MGPLRARLRAATAAPHERVDAAFGALDLGTAPGYRGFLRGQAAALVPLEALLERRGVTGLIPDWPERARRHALAADLAPEAPPPPVPAPADATPAGLLGMLYVLEGSRLGGAVLLRRIPPGAPAAFLRHAAPEPFSQFMDRLEAHPAAVADPAAVLDGALAAFAAFERAARDEVALA